MGPLRALGADRKNLRFSPRPEAEGIPREGNVFAFDDLNRAFEEKLLQVGPKIVRHQVGGVPKSGSALFGTGIISSGPERFGLLSSLAEGL